MTQTNDQTAEPGTNTVHSEFVTPSRPGGYEGVRHPISFSPVHPTSNSPCDDQLLADVRCKLEEEGRLQRAELKLSIRSGVVTLEGRVPSEFLRGLAKAIAESSTGVLLVEDKLHIAEPPPDGE